MMVAGVDRNPSLVRRGCVLAPVREAAAAMAVKHDGAVDQLA
jgi:hypothetical protein